MIYIDICVCECMCAYLSSHHLNMMKMKYLDSPGSGKLICWDSSKGNELWFPGMPPMHRQPSTAIIFTPPEYRGCFVRSKLGPADQIVNWTSILKSEVCFGPWEDLPRKRHDEQLASAPQSGRLCESSMANRCSPQCIELDLTWFQV